MPVIDKIRVQALGAIRMSKAGDWQKAAAVISIELKLAGPPVITPDLPPVVSIQKSLGDNTSGLQRSTMPFL